MSTALKQMTVDEFLPWAEGKEGRWELHDGVPVMISSADPVMMSPERAAHIRTKFSAAKALDGAVAAAGLPCEVFTDGMAIQSRCADDLRAGRLGCLRSRVARRRHRDRQSHRRRRSPVAQHRGDRSRPQAQRLFLAAERRALSDPRSRAAGRDPPQARAGRGDRDARAFRAASRQARSARVRGCGRGAVPAP